MNPLRFAALAALPLVFAACTSLEPAISTKPQEGYDLVDTSKVDKAKYEEDYTACATIANQENKNLGKTTTNAISTTADKVSMGIIGQRASKDADRMTVVKRCLTGRGYHVLR